MVEMRKNSNRPNLKKQAPQNLIQDQQMDFLKDTVIDRNMLSNKQPNERYERRVDDETNLVVTQQHSTKTRPKTSENYRDAQNRQNVMVQQHQVQQMIQIAKNQMSNKNTEISNHEGKFKSSQNTQYETLDGVDMARNRTNMSNQEHLYHNISHEVNQEQQHYQQFTRPFTQQNYYESHRNSGQSQGQNHHQQSLRVPVSANVSCSGTSGLESQRSNHIQPKQQQNDHINERQYSTQQQFVDQRQQQPNRREFQLALGQQHTDPQNGDHGQLAQQYNTVVYQHITPKNKPEKTILPTEGSHPQVTRYKTNNQFQSSNQSTVERQPAISSHRGSSAQQVPGPNISQNQILSTRNKQGGGNSVESKKIQGGKIVQQKAAALAQQKQLKLNEFSNPQSHRAAQADAQNLLKQQQRKNQSASGSRERREKQQGRQPMITQSNVNKVYSSQKTFDQKKQSVKEQFHNPLQAVHTTSPSKEKRQNLEIQTKQKLIKQIRTNVQTPTQNNNPHQSIQQDVFAVNQMFIQAQNERSNSGENNQRQYSSGHKGQNQMILHQQMVQNSKQVKSRERAHPNNINTAPVSRGNSAKNRQQATVPLDRLNTNLNQRFSSKKQLNADEIVLQKMNQQPKQQNQQPVKSRNNPNALNGISKTVGVGQQVNAAGALVSHRVSVNNTLVDDISNINSMNAQLQKQIGTKQGNKMKLKIPKSQDKTRTGNYQTTNQGQMLSQRSNKMQLNMKAVLSQHASGSGQTTMRQGPQIQSVRNLTDKNNNQFSSNSSQKFFIDHNNPNLNLGSLQHNANTYTLTSLENTNQDINIHSMAQTGQNSIGLAFPSTPNIQSARGSAHKGMIPNQPMGSSRSIQSLNQSSKQIAQSQQTTNQKQITIKKIIEGQQSNLSCQPALNQRQENSYELLQRQKQSKQHYDRN